MISVIILTLNNAETLAQTLNSVKDFEEILIIDSGSSDRTPKIAEKYPNCRFLTNTPFPGFGPQRQFAEKQCKYDWILALDSDESLSDELKDELFNLKLEPNYIYSISRKNFFRNKRIKFSSWSPDYCLRLYNKQTTGFNSALVHENIETKNCQIKRLKGAIFHTPYRSLSDFLTKMEKYTSYFAKQNQGKRRSSFSKALFRGAWSFFRTYIIKLGILDGKEGFIISIYNAECAYYKYLKLHELNQDSSMSA